MQKNAYFSYLTINNVQEEDGGIYLCQYGEHNISVNLVVIYGK